MDTLFDEEDGQRDRAPAGRTNGAPQPPDGPQNHPNDPQERPLAVRIRPKRLEDFVGQSHLLGEGSALRSAIERGAPHSMILHGPPGSGKTTLARMIAERSNAAFEELSAVQAGRPEVREVLERARQRLVASDRRTVFFLDEIHRFNKAQQDALLPAVEEGLVTLIGATTENPAFEVNGALLSRVRIYALAALSADEVASVLRQALARSAAEASGEEVRSNEPQGEEVEVEEEAIDFLAMRSDGDARTALNALELAIATAAALGERSVSLQRAEDALQQRAVLYDRKGDRHYDYISAWIKATRGSDPDASLYYLAVMLEGGEDPRFIARRMIILASEDVGNADPAALTLAVSVAQAVEHVGMPEARYALAQAAIYLSLAPKSNAAGSSLAAAQRHIQSNGAAPVPSWLRSGPRPGLETGGYDYPHAHAGHVCAQELAPETVVGMRFFEPDEAEPQLAARLAQIRHARGRPDSPGVVSRGIIEP